MALRVERIMPKWVQKTLQDSKLEVALPHQTRVGTNFGREQVEWTCMSTLYDTQETNSFKEAKECEHWQHAMQ